MAIPKKYMDNVIIKDENGKEITSELRKALYGHWLPKIIQRSQQNAYGNNWWYFLYRFKMWFQTVIERMLNHG